MHLDGSVRQQITVETRYILSCAVISTGSIGNRRITAVHIQYRRARMVRGVGGAGFAFVPRSLVAQPKAFGAASGLLEPAQGVDVTSERYRAAMLQHVMVVAVKGELLKSDGITPAAFVARLEGRGLGEDRVRRIFRGETMAQLTDLMFWSALLPAVGAAISEFMTRNGHEADSGGVELPAIENAEIPGTDTASISDSAAGLNPDEPEWLVRARHKQRVREIQAAAGMGSGSRPPLR